MIRERLARFARSPIKRNALRVSKHVCNEEYTKHCTRSRHQLKMAAPGVVSKTHSKRENSFFRMIVILR